MPKYKAYNTTKLQRKAQNYVITAYKFISGAGNEEELKSQMDSLKNSIASINQMTARYSNPDPDGNIPTLDDTQVKELKKQYKDAMMYCAMLKSSASAGPYKNAGLSAMTESLGSLISKDFKTLQKYDSRAPQTLPGLIESSHTSKVVLEGEGSKLGGSQNTRLAMEITQPGGQKVKGVFTESKFFDPEANAEEVLSKLNSKYPQYKEVTDRLLSVYSNDRKKLFADISVDLPRVSGSDEVAFAYYGDRKEIGDILAPCLSDRNAWPYLSDLLSGADRVTSQYAIGQDMLHLKKGAPLDARNNIFYAGASFFGFDDLVVKSVPMEVEVNGKTVKGSFMDFAEGFDLLTVREEQLEGIDMKSFDTVAGKVSVANLGALDTIFGNVDRTGLNMFYRFGGVDGKQFLGVTAIDNDSSFGIMGRQEFQGNGIGRLAEINRFPLVTEKMADAIERTTPEMFSMMLAGYGLSAEEIKAACDRLEMIRERLDKSPLKTPDVKPTLENGRIKVMTDEQIGMFTLHELSMFNNSREHGIWTNFHQGALELIEKKIEVNFGPDAEFANAKADQKADTLDFEKLSRKLNTLEANLNSVNHGLFISSHQFDRVLAAVKHARQELANFAKEEAAAEGGNADHDPLRERHQQTAGVLMADIHNAASAYLFNKEYNDTFNDNSRSAKRFAKVVDVLSFAENYVDRMDVSDRLYFRNAREDEKIELAKARGDLGRKFRQLAANRPEPVVEPVRSREYMDADDHIKYLVRDIKEFYELYETAPSTDGDLKNVYDAANKLHKAASSVMVGMSEGLVDPRYTELVPTLNDLKTSLANYNAKVASGNIKEDAQLSDAVARLGKIVEENEGFVSSSVKGLDDFSHFHESFTLEQETAAGKEQFSRIGIDGRKPTEEECASLSFETTPVEDIFSAMVWMQAQDSRIQIGAALRPGPTVYSETYSRLTSELAQASLDKRLEFYKLVKRHEQSLDADVKAKYTNLQNEIPDGPDKEKRVMETIALDKSFMDASLFASFKQSQWSSLGPLEIMASNENSKGVGSNKVYPDVGFFTAYSLKMPEVLKESYNVIKTRQVLSQIDALNESGYIPRESFMSDEMIAAKKWYVDFAEKLPQYGIDPGNSFSLARIRIDNDLDYDAYRNVRDSNDFEDKKKHMDHIENSSSYALMETDEKGRYIDPLTDPVNTASWISGKIKFVHMASNNMILKLYKAAKDNKLFIHPGIIDAESYRNDRMIFVGNDGKAVVTDELKDFACDKAMKEKKYEKYQLTEKQADKIYLNHQRLNRMQYDAGLMLEEAFDLLPKEDGRLISEKYAKVITQSKIVEMGVKTPKFLNNLMDFSEHSKAFYNFAIDPKFRTAEENKVVLEDPAVHGYFEVVDDFLTDKLGPNFKIKNIKAADENGAPIKNDMLFNLYKGISRCMMDGKEFYINGEPYCMQGNRTVVNGLGMKHYSDQLSVLAEQVKKRGASDGPGADDYRSFALELSQLPKKINDLWKSNEHRFNELQKTMVKAAAAANAYIEKTAAKEGKLSSKELNALKQVNRFLDINDKVMAKDAHPENNPESRVAEKLAIYSAQQKANSKDPLEAGANRVFLFDRQRRKEVINEIMGREEFSNILASSKVSPTDLLKFPAEKLSKLYVNARDTLQKQRQAENRNPQVSSVPKANDDHKSNEKQKVIDNL